MVNRIGTVLVCWLMLSSAGWAQLRDVKVSGPTRLDWELAAYGFGRDPAADLPADYDSKKQKYQLFVPGQRAAANALPLIVFISPGPGPIGWPTFEGICVREGMLFCSPYKAGNTTTPALRIRIILDMVDDVRRKFPIDPNQTYIGGFSGGGRMSCSIGFAMPELFAGIMPVCGTNPINSLHHYLRHRLVDRVSVAFVTGQKDYNRSEHDQWMAPYLKELDIRTQFWVVPGMGHDIPNAAVMEEVVGWLAADLKHRREDTKTRPKLSVKFDEAFRGDAEADRLLAAARSELDDKERLWQGFSLLLAVTKRWPDSAAAGKSKELMQTILADQAQRADLDRLRLADDRKSFGAQARGLERAGRIPKAIEVWETLARNHRDTPTAEEARAEIQRLQELPPPVELKPQVKVAKKNKGAK